MRPVRATLAATCPPGDLFRWVDDLSRYPQWLDLVQRADPVGEGTWSVVLTAQLGPVRRSKRLTMVRVDEEARPGAVQHARFERREGDGRDHAAWELDAEVVATAEGSELVMELRYDGRWWGPVMERVLRDQIESARPRLSALAAG